MFAVHRSKGILSNVVLPFFQAFRNQYHQDVKQLARCIVVAVTTTFMEVRLLVSYVAKLRLIFVR